MDKSIKSKLSFLNYKVEEVKFKNNNEFKNNGEPINIDFNIKYKTNINDNRMDVELIVKVFEEMKKNNYPFQLETKVIGKFMIQGEDIRRFEINAIAILYPYIRAIISTYTANSNIPTLILPPINVNKLIEDQERKD